MRFCSLSFSCGPKILKTWVLLSKINVFGSKNDLKMDPKKEAERVPWGSKNRSQNDLILGPVLGAILGPFWGPKLILKPWNIEFYLVKSMLFMKIGVFPL